jgi:hypothetical protein
MPRRFQFSLRGLLILMLAVACFCGGIVFEREHARRQAVQQGWVDIGVSAIDDGSDLEILAVAPGQFSLIRRSPFALVILWVIALIAAFLAGMALQRKLSRKRPQPLQSPGNPDTPAG